MFKKLSKKIGFTETEVSVILFLAGIFILGFIYKEFFKDDGNAEYKNFNYSSEDSLFSYYSKLNPESDPEDSLLASNLEIKRKVLELTDTFAFTKKKHLNFT